MAKQPRPGQPPVVDLFEEIKKLPRPTDKVSVPILPGATREDVPTVVKPVLPPGASITKDRLGREQLTLPGVEYAPTEDEALMEEQRQEQDELEFTAGEIAKDEEDKEYILSADEDAELDLSIEEALSKSQGVSYNDKSDKAIEALNKDMGKYGIRFVNIGGNVRATATRTGKSIDVDLQQVFTNIFDRKGYFGLAPMGGKEATQAERDEAKKLKDFIKNNATSPMIGASKYEDDKILDKYAKVNGTQGQDVQRFVDEFEERNRKKAFLESIEERNLTGAEQTRLLKKAGYQNVVGDGRDVSRILGELTKEQERSYAAYQDLKDNVLNKADAEKQKIIDEKKALIAKKSKDLTAGMNLLKDDFRNRYDMEFSEETLKNMVFNSQAELDEVNKYINRANALAVQGNEIKKLYDDSNTYLNSKHDKNFKQEYVSAYQGMVNVIKNGWNRARASKIVLAAKIDKLNEGITPEDRESYNRRVAELMNKPELPITAIQYDMYKAMQSGNQWELLSLIFNNPLNFISAATTLASESFAQMIYLTGAEGGILTASGALIGGIAGGITSRSLAGARAGAAAGLRTAGTINATVGNVATNLAMETALGMYGALQEKYTAEDVLNGKWLDDPEIMDKAFRHGLTRGSTIGLTELIGYGVMSRFRVSSIASTPKRLAQTIAMGSGIEIAQEMTGEALAQVVSGEDLNAIEIIAEGLGAVGMVGANPFGFAKEVYEQVRTDYYTDLADNMAVSRSFINNTKDNVEDVARWAKNMKQSGKISEDTERKIIDNISDIRQARAAIGAMEDTDAQRQKIMEKGTNSKAENRLADLFAAKRKLERVPDLNKPLQQAIKDEISEISLSKKVPSKGVDISSVVGTGPTYKYRGQYVTGRQLQRLIVNTPDYALDSLEIEIEGDEKMSQLLRGKAEERIDFEYDDMGEQVTFVADTKEQIPVRFRKDAQLNEETGMYEATVDKTELRKPKKDVSASDYAAFQAGNVSEAVLDDIADDITEGRKLTEKKAEIYKANKEGVLKRAGDMFSMATVDSGKRLDAAKTKLSRGGVAYAKDKRTGKVYRVDNAADLDRAYRSGMRILTEKPVRKVEGKLKPKKYDKKRAAPVQQPMDTRMKYSLIGYHASPSLFDKFSLDYVGKGVGASRGGVGMYFTLQKETAKRYANKFAKEYIGNNERKIYKEDYPDLFKTVKETLEKVGGKRVSFAKEMLKKSRELRDEALSERNIILKEIGYSEEQIRNGDYDMPSNYELYLDEYFFKADEYRSIARMALKNMPQKLKDDAYLYKVIIAETGNWIDFSKPLTDAQYDAILNQAILENSPYLDAIKSFDRDNSGRDFYWGVSNKVFANERNLSALLSRAGIDGNFNTEDAGETIEYVVFSEDAVTIEEATKFQQAERQEAVRKWKSAQEISAFKDLATRVAGRIGATVKFINDPNEEYRGYYDPRMHQAVINLAYATSETVFHEILGHPIILAMKSNPEYAQLYENLKNEVLNSPLGQEVLANVREKYNFNNEDDVMEEAIVQLLGMRTDEAFSEKANLKLLSQIKKWLKEMAAWVRDTLRKQGITIEDFPVDATIEDIGKLLGYSNQNIILPGFVQEFKTPTGLVTENYADVQAEMALLAGGIKVERTSKVDEITALETKMATIISSDNNYPNNPEYIKAKKELEKIVDELLTDGKVEVINHFNGMTITTIESRDGKYYIGDVEAPASDVYKMVDGSKRIAEYIKHNKEFARNKSIILNWKEANGIVYNPEEAYSRGHVFTSEIGLYSNFDTIALLQNLMDLLDDVDNAGGEIVLSTGLRAAYEPDDADNLMNIGQSLQIIMYPAPDDILWASDVDVMSGTVAESYRINPSLDAVDESFAKAVSGTSLTKYPGDDYLDSIQPNIADCILPKSKVYYSVNEQAVRMNGNNWRIQYRPDAPLELKKLADTINGKLDEKYGPISAPKIARRIPYQVGDVVDIEGQKFEILDSMQVPPSTNIFSRPGGRLSDSETVLGSRRFLLKPLSVTESGIESLRARFVLQNRNYFNRDDFSLSISELELPIRLDTAPVQRADTTEDYRPADDDSFAVTTQQYDTTISEAKIASDISALRSILKKYPRAMVMATSKMVNRFSQDIREKFQKLSSALKDVEKLFESDSNLASQVYEALGFKIKTSENEITRNIIEILPFKVIGDYSNIEEGLTGRKFYEEIIDNNIYRFTISTYNYENEDGAYQHYYDIDFTVNGSEELVGSGFFNKAEKAKQIIQALLSQNFGNDTVRFNVEESHKGKQRLVLYKRLMSQLGYSPSDTMEYALFYNIKRKDFIETTPRQKQQALQAYSQYLEQNPNGNVEQFKSWVSTRGDVFSIDGKTKFFHASDQKRRGRLKKSTALQFGSAVYFSTSKQLVMGEFGDNVTEVELDLKNPVYTNTKQWSEVEELAIKLADDDYGRRKNLKLEEDETYFRFTLGDFDEIPSRFISQAAEQLGYDAIVDKNSRNYENEIAVLNEAAIIYEEDTRKFQKPSSALKDVESTAKALEEKYSAQPIKINSIVNDNPQEIYALSIGINPSNLFYLGKGDYGEAYSTDSGTVIKITSSANEAEIALSLIGKKGDHAEIYDVKKVGSKFIIYQEKLDTDSEIEDNLQTIENILNEQELPIQYLNYLDYDELSQESKDKYDSLSDFISDLKDINRLYNNLGIEASDLQSGNLGYGKNGKLKAFDLQDKSSKIKSKDVNAGALKDKNQVISEAYHKAKKDGSNPELVKAVEELLSPQETDTRIKYSKIGVPSPAKSNDIVDEFIEARSLGYPDDAIERMLLSDGYEKDDVEALMELGLPNVITGIKEGETIKLPASFANATGGAEAGTALYNRVRNGAIDAYINRRKDRVEGQAPIGDRIVDHLVATLKADETFKASPKDVQQAMLVDIVKSSDVRLTKNKRAWFNREKIKQKGIEQGKKIDDKLKGKLISYIIINLPKAFYTRNDVKQLLQKVKAAETTNIMAIQEEVLDFVTKTNVGIVKEKINALLKKDTTKQKSGREVGAISMAAQEYMDGVEALMMKEGESSGLQIESSIQRINEQLSALLSKYESAPYSQREAMENQMSILYTALMYNSSLLIEDTNDGKLEALEEVLAAMKEVLAEGKADFIAEIKKATEKYNNMKAAFFEDITGGMEIDYTASEKKKQEVMYQLEDIKQGRENVNWLQRIGNLFMSAVKGTEDLDALLDRIALLPSEFFENGIAKSIISGKIFDSRREQARLKKMTTEMIRDAAKKIFGENYKKVMANNAKSTITVTARNGRSVIMSLNEAYYYYNMYKDPANHPSFQTTFGDDYHSTMYQIIERLSETPKILDWADWQVDVMYPILYDEYNAVYRRIYRTDMPWNRFYAGRIYRDGVDMKSPIDIFSPTSPGSQEYFGGTSTKSRKENKNAIKQVDGDYVLFNYLEDMNFFASFGESLRDINKILSDKYIAKAIEAKHSKKDLNNLREMIKRIYSQGLGDSNISEFFGSGMKNFITAKLAFNPKIMLQQLGTFIGYVPFIGYTNWGIYAGKVFFDKIRGINTWKEMKSNSQYLTDRFSDIDIREVLSGVSAARSKKLGVLPDGTWDKILSMSMIFMRAGDQMGIMGAMPNYLYYKESFMKQGRTEEQAIAFAIQRIEKQTQKVAQSNFEEDKDLYQTGNAFYRAFSIFASQPKQYFRQEVNALRNMYRILANTPGAKGTFRQNLRAFITYHFVAPLMFQWIVSGFPRWASEWDDDDTEDMIWAAILGNINAIFIIGDLFVGVKDVITGKPWAGKIDSLPVLMQIGDVLDTFSSMYNAKKEETRWKNAAKLASQMAEFTGLPAGIFYRYIMNYIEFTKDKDNFGESVLRLLGYSDYVVKGANKQKESSSAKLKTDRLGGDSLKPDKL